MKNLSEALESSRLGDGHFEYTDEYDTEKLKSTLISLLDEVVMEEKDTGTFGDRDEHYKRIGYNACRQELIKRINEIKK